MGMNWGLIRFSVDANAICRSLGVLHCVFQVYAHGTLSVDANATCGQSDILRCFRLPIRIPPGAETLQQLVMAHRLQLNK